MKKTSVKIIGILLFMALTTIHIACEENETPDSLNLINGTVLYMAPPDNCNDYIIKADNNTYYKPSNLSEDFKVTSLKIKFEFDETENTHDCGFGGPISVIDLIHIEKR